MNLIVLWKTESREGRAAAMAARQSEAWYRSSPSKYLIDGRPLANT
jgi:hypothetical protein